MTQVETPPLGFSAPAVMHPVFFLPIYLSLLSPRVPCIHNTLLFLSSLTRFKDRFKAAAHHSYEKRKCGPRWLWVQWASDIWNISIACRIQALAFPGVQFTLKRKLLVIKEMSLYPYWSGPHVTSVSNNIHIPHAVSDDVLPKISFQKSICEIMVSNIVTDVSVDIHKWVNPLMLKLFVWIY